MRLADAARAAMFALLPPAAAGGALALAPLLGLAGAASWRPSLVRRTLGKPPLYLSLLGLFAAWMALSALWSPYDDPIQALKFALTLGAGLLFVSAASADAAARRLTLAALLAALGVLAALLAIEALGGMPFNHAANPGQQDWQIAGNPGRGAAVLTCLIWAALGLFAARRAWLLTALAFIAAGALAAQFGQSANLVAFALGGAAFAAGWLAPRFAIWTTSAAFAAWLLLAPFIVPLLASHIATDALPYSWQARLAIWRYVCARVAEHPIFGSGLDASRSVTDRLVVQGENISAVPLHPHSASLQIWFETGAIGAALGAAVLLAGGWTLSRRWSGHRAGAAAACGALAAIGVIANVSFGVWQEWWNAAMLITAASVSALARN